MKNEKVYESMSGTEVGLKLEKIMVLVDDMVLDAGKNISIIQHMTENYEQYLHEYSNGGDWTFAEFMESIAKRAKTANNILGIADDENKPQKRFDD